MFARVNAVPECTGSARVPRRAILLLFCGLCTMAALALSGCLQQPRTNASGPQVKLSAGVALGQTTLEGTVMMFSVDYRFLNDARPQEGMRYAWVIEPGQGEPLEQEVQLRRQSTLQAIVPQWRPENGPFICHIDELSPDGTRRTISERYALR